MGWGDEPWDFSESPESKSPFSSRDFDPACQLQQYSLRLVSRINEIYIDFYFLCLFLHSYNVETGRHSACDGDIGNGHQTAGGVILNNAATCQNLATHHHYSSKCSGSPDSPHRWLGPPQPRWPCYTRMTPRLSVAVASYCPLGVCQILDVCRTFDKWRSWCSKRARQ